MLIKKTQGKRASLPMSTLTTTTTKVSLRILTHLGELLDVEKTRGENMFEVWM